MAFDRFQGHGPAVRSGRGLRRLMQRLMQPEHVVIKTIVRFDRAHRGAKKRLSMRAMSVRLALFCCVKRQCRYAVRSEPVERT